MSVDVTAEGAGAAETRVPITLTHELASPRLSHVLSTRDGRGYAYATLDVAHLRIATCAPGLFTALPHVRYVSAGGNALTRIDSEWFAPLVASEVADGADAAAGSGSTSLVTLALPHNRITRLCDLTACKHLQQIDLSFNALVRFNSTREPLPPTPEVAATRDDGVVEDVDGEEAPVDDSADGSDVAAAGVAQLSPEDEAAAEEAASFVFAAPTALALLVNGNKLASLEGLATSAFPRLVRLEAASNVLHSLRVEYLPALRELILPNNKLTRLEGLENLPHLRVLNVDGNQLRSLRGIIDVVATWAVAGQEAELVTGDVRPLSELSVLSARNNALPEDAWENIDALAPLRHLTELRISGNGLAESVYKPKTLQRDIQVSINGALDDDFFAKFDMPELEPVELKVELLVRLPQLRRIEDDFVSPVERRTAAGARAARAAADAVFAAAQAAAEVAVAAIAASALDEGVDDDVEEEEEA